MSFQKALSETEQNLRQVSGEGIMISPYTSQRRINILVGVCYKCSTGEHAKSKLSGGQAIVIMPATQHVQQPSELQVIASIFFPWHALLDIELLALLPHRLRASGRGQMGRDG